MHLKTKRTCQLIFTFCFYIYWPNSFLTKVAKFSTRYAALVELCDWWQSSYLYSYFETQSRTSSLVDWGAGGSSIQFVQLSFRMFTSGGRVRDGSCLHSCRQLRFWYQSLIRSVVYCNKCSIQEIIYRVLTMISEHMLNPNFIIPGFPKYFTQKSFKF